MNGIFSLILDVVLIGLLGAGIYYAVRLSRQMAGLRASRAEMERFVLDFSTTVQRAEAGIYGLKQAARTGGDDLEQLIEKAQTLRDELHFLVESADQIASRLSDTAAAATRLATNSGSGTQASEAKPIKKTTTVPHAVSNNDAPGNDKKPNSASGAASAAERELLKVLEKLG